jgi:hypothetical protein
MLNARDFGAVGDGAANDRPALQAALDAGTGGEVFVPAGVYLVDKSAGFWCLDVPAGTTVRGEPGTVLKQTAGIPGAVRLLHIGAGGVVLDTLTLDGNKSAQSPDEHRAGVFAQNAPGLVIRNVTARGFTGDGFYIYVGANDVLIDGCTSMGNDRNGITFGGGTTGGLVVNSTFAGSKSQQFDSEPVGTAVDGLTIRGCAFDTGGATDQYVLTISGGSSTAISRGWLVEDCAINGAVNVVWASGIRIRRCHGANATPTAWRVYRTCDDITICDNQLTATGVTAHGFGLLCVVGTGEGSPRRVRILRNELAVVGAIADVIHCEGAGSVEICDNTLSGPGLISAVPAITLRATMTAHPFTSAVIRRNEIRGCGRQGIQVWGNGAAPLEFLDVSDNVFDGAGGTMTAAMSLNYDSAGAAKHVQVRGNILLGVPVLSDSAPVGVWSALGAGDQWIVP